MRFISIARQVLPIILILAGIYWQVSSYDQTIFGFLILALYFFITGLWWKDVFESRFFGTQSGVVGSMYGFATTFFLSGLITSTFVVWYKLTPTTITCALAVATTISFYFWHKYTGSYPASHGQSSPDHVFFPGKSFLIFLFILLWIGGMYIYMQVAETGVYETPWQILPESIWIIFFFLATLIGIFIFSKIKSGIVLFLIILFSFYTHVYLPASHVLPWGGDVWRLIAVEEKLLQEKIELPVLFGPERTVRVVGEYAVPDALVVPHKYTYGHLWGTSVLAAKILSISLLTINKWLMPLIWSLCIPVIFYRTGTVLFDSRRKGLLAAWASCLVFTLQAVGALTLPVSLGTLTFFFAVSLLIESVKQKKRAIWSFLILFGALLFFGYILHALLFFLLLCAAGTVVFFDKKIWLPDKGNRVLYGMGIILAILFIPAIELVTNSSTWPAFFEWKKQLLQMTGQLSGWFYASMIRPHDILSGNILFNHTPAAAFVENIMNTWRYHVFFVSLVVWISAGYGFFHATCFKKNISWQMIGVLAAAVIGGYSIGWYLLTGERLFTRRLDPVIAYVIILFGIYGISAFLPGQYVQRISLRIKRVGIFFMVLLCSWFGTTAWISGPDMHVTSHNEFAVAQFLANTKQEISCVLADTWILLPLEGLTAGRIVGGGFPISYQFSQPERVALYQEFQAKPLLSITEKIASIVPASSCYLVLPTDNVELANELGTPVYHERGHMIWLVDLKKGSE